MLKANMSDPERGGQRVLLIIFVLFMVVLGYDIVDVINVWFRAAREA
jgi:hypothetical protein